MDEDDAEDAPAGTSDLPGGQIRLWLKQIQAPGELPFHRHWFIPPGGLSASVSPSRNLTPSSERSESTRHLGGHQVFQLAGGPFSVGFSLCNAAASSDDLVPESWNKLDDCSAQGGRSHPDTAAVPGCPSRDGAEHQMEQLAPSGFPAP